MVFTAGSTDTTAAPDASTVKTNASPVTSHCIDAGLALATLKST